MGGDDALELPVDEPDPVARLERIHTTTSELKGSGLIDGAQKIAGRTGNALRFRGTRGGGNQGSFVQHKWDRDLPILVRAMVKAKDRIYVAGPPDLIDEEDTFQRTMARDPVVFVRGKVWHPDHATIRLDGWHRVEMNTENRSRAMASVAFSSASRIAPSPIENRIDVINQQRPLTWILHTPGPPAS